MYYLSLLIQGKGAAKIMSLLKPCHIDYSGRFKSIVKKLKAAATASEARMLLGVLEEVKAEETKPWLFGTTIPMVIPQDERERVIRWGVPHDVTTYTKRELASGNAIIEVFDLPELPFAWMSELSRRYGVTITVLARQHGESFPRYYRIDRGAIEVVPDLSVRW